MVEYVLWVFYIQVRGPRFDPEFSPFFSLSKLSDSRYLFYSLFLLHFFWPIVKRILEVNIPSRLDTDSAAVHSQYEEEIFWPKLSHHPKSMS